MILRDYQLRAVSVVRDHWRVGVRAVCLVCPTGGGKTAMAQELATGSTPLFIVHRRELVAQARAHGGMRAATVQGLASSGERPDADLIIVDECHTVGMTPEWRVVLSRYPDSRILGLTATPERRDGAALSDVYERMVVAAQYSELISEGYLVPARVFRPATQIADGIAQKVVDSWRSLAGQEQGFVYCNGVAGAKSAAEDLTAAGYPSACIDGAMSAGARDYAIHRFRAGHLRVLTNCFCLVEGFDAPAASVCMLARGFSHIGAYCQAVGRVLRPSPGKTRATVIDLSGASHAHGLPGSDLLYSLDGVPMRPTTGSLSTCRKCYAAYPPAAKCPECGHMHVSKSRNELRIYSMELREVYAGQDTPVDAKVREWERLANLAQTRGYSVGWAVREYRKLFNSAPEKHRVIPYLERIANEKNYKKGWVWHAAESIIGKSR